MDRNANNSYCWNCCNWNKFCDCSSNCNQNIGITGDTGPKGEPGEPLKSDIANYKINLNPQMYKK